MILLVLFILCFSLFLFFCNVYVYIKNYRTIVAFLHNVQPLVNLIRKYSQDDYFDKLKNMISKYEKKD